MTSTARKIITSLAVAGAAAAISVGGAATASAQQYGTYPLSPGAGQCTPTQYAGFQVRADACGDRRRREVQAGPQRRGRRQHPEPGEQLVDRAAQRVRHLPRPRLLLGVRPEHRHQEHHRHPPTAHRLRVLGDGWARQGALAERSPGAGRCEQHRTLSGASHGAHPRRSPRSGPGAQFRRPAGRTRPVRRSAEHPRRAGRGRGARARRHRQVDAAPAVRGVRGRAGRRLPADRCPGSAADHRGARLPAGAGPRRRRRNAGPSC